MIAEGDGAVIPDALGVWGVGVGVDVDGPLGMPPGAFWGDASIRPLGAPEPSSTFMGTLAAIAGDGGGGGIMPAIGGFC